MVSAIDYMERVLGYGPRVAQERLRVARVLGTLPELTAALSQGELSYSAVRELTRVVNPATEAEWRQAAIGKNLRQIEELVADHQPGDNPDDPGDPQVRRHVVRFELSAETFAVLRQARQVLDDEHGSNLSDDELVATLSGAVLDGGTATEPTGRARFQIAVTLCEQCGQGWQDGAGAKVAIDGGSVERALCDAQHIGSIDGGAPERAHQDVPPSIARLVWRRDGGRCRVPGCRSARNLEIHHLIHRTDGGSHDAMNLLLTCGSCHMAHHRGALTISGTADRIEVIRHANTPLPRSQPRGAGAHVGAFETAVARKTVAPKTVAPVAATPAKPQPASAESRAAEPEASGPSKLDAVIVRAQTKAALVSLVDTVDCDGRGRHCRGGARGGCAAGTSDPRGTAQVSDARSVVRGAARGGARGGAGPRGAPGSARYRRWNITNASTSPWSGCAKAPGRRPTIAKPIACHSRTARSLVEITMLNCIARNPRLRA
jgi:hypothetical protein